MGMLISCGSLTAWTHTHTSTHTYAHIFTERLWSQAVCGKRHSVSDAVSWCSWLDERGLFSCLFFLLSFCFFHLLNLIFNSCSLWNPCSHFTFTAFCNRYIICSYIYLIFVLFLCYILFLSAHVLFRISSFPFLLLLHHIIFTNSTLNSPLSFTLCIQYGFVYQ